MRFLLFLSILFLLSCSSGKKVFICGDRECLNKKEAEKYFAENLILEIKIIKNKKIKSYDLVKMNTGNFENKVEIAEETKQENNELSKSDKKIIKKKLKDEKKIAKLKQKQEIKRQKEKKKLAKLNKKETLKKIKPIKKPDNQIVQYEEICSTLDKCEIDEISSYLMKIGKTKKYPDLSSE